MKWHAPAKPIIQEMVLLTPVKATIELESIHEESRVIDEPLMASVVQEENTIITSEGAALKASVLTV